MPSNPDLLAFIALTCIVAGYLIFKLVIKRLSFERKRSLIIRFQQLRKQSLSLQELLSEYMLSTNAERKLVKDNVTFAEYYRQLKSNHVTHLSSKFLDKLQKSNNPLLLKKTADVLKHQEIKLKDAENVISGIVINKQL